MFQKLVSHNDDINRLVEKGYAVAFDSGYMIIRDIPYLDSERKPQLGAFVSKLVFVDAEHVIQENHVMFFAGSVPHGTDGNPIPNLGGGPTQLALGEASKDIVVQRSFSNKPFEEGKFHDFKDFFQKVESYVAIICGPATELYGVTPFTFMACKESGAESVFRFQDTLTSRAEIGDLSTKFKDDIVAIIGVGGTGAYVLDFLSKTAVREIRVFDLDPFHVHNAFRSPGRLDPTEFGKPKAEVYFGRYDNFRKGIVAKPKVVDSTCGDDVAGVTFAFVCVDKGTSRAGILDLLIARRIPFIDVGMGLHRKDDKLTGTLRTTFFSAEHAQVVRDKRVVEEGEGEDNLYRTNIQISELNALNACLAVVRFKQLRGFYLEEVGLWNAHFTIGNLKIKGESEYVEGQA